MVMYRSPDFFLYGFVLTFILFGIVGVYRCSCCVSTARMSPLASGSLLMRLKRRNHPLLLRSGQKDVIICTLFRTSAPTVKTVLSRQHRFRQTRDTTSFPPIMPTTHKQSTFDKQINRLSNIARPWETSSAAEVVAGKFNQSLARKALKSAG
jgi:hypothetical protein